MAPSTPTLYNVFLPALQFYVSIIPSMLHTHSFIYHPRCITFFSQYFSFPRQYHSSNAPNAFILPTIDAVLRFSPSTSVSPIIIIPPMLHTHSSIYNQRCMFFSQYSSFPRQYHSTNAPYSYIHLPQTLYNVFLPVLQFPLSVLIHQCSILIHSSTTNAVCFSLSTPVSPVSIIPPMLHTHSSIYHQSCMFFSQYSSFPCQYHSTNTPYSYIHLRQTLYSVFLPVLQFPLSVSFHQCSVLIHSSTTNAVCFSLSTPISPVSIIPPILHTHSSIYHQSCMFFSQYSSFPCQYHSTNAPYSSFPCQYHSTNAPYSSFPCQYHSTNAPYTFIHLPPTLYVFLSVLQFPLSVSFHQCSILQVPPVSIIPQMLHTPVSPVSIIPPMLHTAVSPVSIIPPMLHTQVSPVSIIPSMLHTHSFTYHQHCMFFSQYSSFPCQYHSTNAPYSFIHLPSTLYKLRNWQRR